MRRANQVSVPVTKRRSWDEQRYLSLIPCPFCASDDIDVAHIGNDRSKKRSITVKCCGCRIKRTDATLSHGFAWLERVAEKNWNRRDWPIDPMRPRFGTQKPEEN